MHITIELDGQESAGQLKRIAAAVLAIGGVAQEQIVSGQTHVVNVVDATPPARMEPAAPVSAAPLVQQDPYLEGIANRNAPSIAAADLFPSAPAAPQAGAPSTPPVPAPPVPSVPVPHAPSAPAPQASPAVGAEVDKEGLPWDARIHSSSKAKTQDGLWRQRRNLPDGEKERVEQELRAIMAIPVGGMTLPLAATPTPAATATVSGAPIPVAPVPSATDKAPTPAPVSGSNPVPSPPVPQPPAPIAAPLPSAPDTPASTAGVASDAPNVPPPPVPSAPSPVPPAPASASSAGNPFGPLMGKISSNVTQGRLTEAQVHEALREVGLQPGQITMLAARPDLGAIVSARIDALLAGAA